MERLYQQRLAARFHVDITNRPHGNATTSIENMQQSPPLIVRDEIVVDFTLKETNESLRLRGVVVHATPMGIGVELKNVNPHLAEMIRFAVHRMES